MNIDPLTTNTLPVRQGRQHQVMTERMIEMLPRSKLYCLAPLGMGTVEIESLTSYIQRLAWAYRVNPRVLVAEVILPHLSNMYYPDPGHLGSFSRTRSMSINGVGEVARDWAETLEQLTMRSDLRLLTLRPWADGLPAWGLLRQMPQWCPVCYDEWRERKQPVYQPLLWAIQAVTVCLRHAQPLVEHCPACQQSQSAIASKRGLGCCTQCGAWLGSKPRSERSCEEDLLDWQRWTKQVVEELILANRMFGSLPWHMLPAGINACVEAVGGTRQLGRIAGVPNVLFSNWRKQKRTPSFTYLLKVSYALNLSPLQLMTVEPERLKNTLPAKRVYRFPPRVGLPAPASKGDLDSIQVFLQTILEGEVGPLPLRHVAHQLGVGEKFLAGRFPHECTQITAQYQVFRAERAKQRVVRECAEVEQAVLTLDEQGSPLSRSQVVPLLSNPNILRRPEGRATWQAVCRERGLEP
jgi:TniQ